VQGWLSGQTTISSDNDSLLQRLITSASMFTRNHIAREIAVMPYDEWYDCGGQNFISLRQFPVRGVTSVQFCGNEVLTEATGNPPIGGWLLSPPTRLEMRGWRFPSGRSVIRVQYSAGYATDAEAQVVPSMAPYTVQTSLVWLGDIAVTLANGTPLTAVPSSPGALQYSVDSSGNYTFNVAQQGASVLISYSSVPPDLEQAVIELVGERFRQLGRIGLNSQSLAQGETVNYLVKDMSDNIRTTLERYKNQGAW
jgi:hypothetical protein